jgi:hypothetical protein
MNLDTYDLPEEQFKHLVQGKSDLLCELLRQHVITLNVSNLTSYSKDPKFVWDSFQEVLYAASEDARVIQKEKNPDVIKRRRYSFEEPIEKEIKKTEE